MRESALEKTLAEVGRRISRAASRGLNEQNTKASLIEPVLRALGWDVVDFDEVVREYRIKKRDKPVDYALLVLRTPRLFLEAKALGENLDDRRWTNQIMGYASVAGVQWIALTNGDEYRIYNTHAPVSVDEKLFRKVRISDGQPIVQQTLELLAKDRLEENRIEVLWRAHFVDRQVQAAIERLFSGEADMLLVNYVAQQAKNLSAEEIRASLGRCRVHLDFPVPTEALLQTAAQPPRGTKQRGRKGSGERKTPVRSAVSVPDLVQAGLLHPPVEVERTYRGKRLVARIEPDGRVSCQGKTFDSLSTAGGAARASVIGLKPGRRYPQTNGWTFWRIRDHGGQIVDVDVVRRRYVQSRGGGSARAAPGA